MSKDTSRYFEKHVEPKLNAIYDEIQTSDLCLADIRKVLVLMACSVIGSGCAATDEASGIDRDEPDNITARDFVADVLNAAQINSDVN
jgi:hypothetical protein